MLARVRGKQCLYSDFIWSKTRQPLWCVAPSPRNDHLTTKRKSCSDNRSACPFQFRPKARIRLRRRAMESNTDQATPAQPHAVEVCERAWLQLWDLIHRRIHESDMRPELSKWETTLIP